MKTCALAPLNKADTFFGGNGGASSSQKCHHCCCCTQFSKMREKRREIRGCPEKQKQKLNLNFLEYRLGLGTKNNFKKNVDYTISSTLSYSITIEQFWMHPYSMCALYHFDEHMCIKNYARLLKQYNKVY